MRQLEARLLTTEAERVTAATEKSSAVRDRAMAERERDIRVRERDEAREALRTSSRSVVPAPAVVESSRAALVQIVEAAIVGRAAEALRRRATEELFMGVATSEQAFRSTTLQNQPRCQCHQQSTEMLTTTVPLPAAASNRALGSTVDAVLRLLRVGHWDSPSDWTPTVSRTTGSTK